MRLYLDEDSQWGALIATLRSAGHDVLTPAEADRMGYPDEAQLQFATEEARVLLSANRHDYARLHHRWMERGLHHAGIVLRRQGTAPGEIARLIGKVEERAKTSELNDRIEWL